MLKVTIKLCINCNKEFKSINLIACYKCYKIVPTYIPGSQVNRYLKEKYENIKKL